MNLEDLDLGWAVQLLRGGFWRNLGSGQAAWGPGGLVCGRFE